MNVFFGNELLYKDIEYISDFSKTDFYICPFCLNYVLLSYNENNNEYVVKTSDLFFIEEHNCNNLFAVKSPEDFFTHVSQCKPIFKTDGIYKIIFDEVNPNSREMSLIKCILIRFNSISKIETNYPQELSLHRTDFLRIIYYLIRDQKIASYLYICYSNDEFSIFIIANAYTLPFYRNNGYASKLLFTFINEYHPKVPQISLPVTNRYQSILKNVFELNCITKLGLMKGVYINGLLEISDLPDNWNDYF